MPPDPVLEYDEDGELVLPKGRTYPLPPPRALPPVVETAAFSGPNVYRYADGSEYAGDWDRGMRSGWGVFTTPDGYQYAGEWLTDRHDGLGVATYPGSGNRYEGEFQRDYRHGRGLFLWRQTGEEYFGWWASDTRSGLGAHLWPDGSKYEGEWAYNEQHGRGRYIWADGRKYEGDFHSGQREGEGFFTGKKNFKGGTWQGGVPVREVKLILEKHRASKTQYPIGKLGNYVVRVRLIAEEARLMTLVIPLFCMQAKKAAAVAETHAAKARELKEGKKRGKTIDELMAASAKRDAEAAAAKAKAAAEAKAAEEAAAAAARAAEEEEEEEESSGEEEEADEEEEALEADSGGGSSEGEQETEDSYAYASETTLTASSAFRGSQRSSSALSSSTGTGTASESETSNTETSSAPGSIRPADRLRLSRPPRASSSGARFTGGAAFRRRWDASSSDGGAGPLSQSVSDSGTSFSDRVSDAALGQRAVTYENGAFEDEEYEEDDPNPWDLPSSASRSESVASEDDRSPNFRRRYPSAQNGAQAEAPDEDAWDEEEQEEEEEEETLRAAMAAATVQEVRPRENR